MLVYYFVPFIVSNPYLLFWVSNAHNSVTVQNRTHVYMNFFDHKDLGNHLLQLCPKAVKHPVYISVSRELRCDIAWLDREAPHTLRHRKLHYSSHKRPKLRESILIFHGMWDHRFWLFCLLGCGTVHFGIYIKVAILSETGVLCTRLHSITTNNTAIISP